ncbi:putative ubiquitin-like-specific protease 2B [Iris pallida]|uniref:Ubiquitin-like-specific protease 2B n=1 Tax=Iris pallida TaxID=29817 RepID=A0AAX6HVZ7_IRIPA|nr:putative ubiquitin-like-specific protease 2B [Iris pallida]KAJ6844727.1 putative ubiquitin-like-specific protease 2B [Iris pallida]
MRASSQKDLSVYDLGADDLSVEASASEYAKRCSSSSLDSKEDERIIKYQFLQAFTSGHRQADLTDISCIDLCEDDTSKESFAIASPDRNVSSEEKSELDEIMASSTSYDEKGNLYLGEFDHATPMRVDPPVEAASGLLVPTVGTEHVAELQSDGSPVDEVSDDEESYTSVNQSPSTSASDLAEDEDHQECPASDNCCSTYEEEVLPFGDSCFGTKCRELRERTIYS